MEGEGDLVEDAIDDDEEIEAETVGKSTKFNEENAGIQTSKSTKDNTSKITGNEKNSTEKSSKYISKEDDIHDNDAPDVKVMNNKSHTTPCETQASRNDSDVVTPPCFINSTLLQQARIDTSAEKETSVGCLDGSPALKTSTGTGKDILPPIKTLGGKDESCNPSLSQQSPSKELEQLPYKEIPPVNYPLTTPPSDDQSTSMKQPPKRAASPHVPATIPHAPSSSPHSPTVVQAKVSSEVSTTKTDKTNQKKDQSLKSAGFVNNQNIAGYATGFNNNNEKEAFSDETNLITVPVSDVLIPKNEIKNLIKDDNKLNAIPNDATSLVEETENNQKEDVCSTLNEKVVFLNNLKTNLKNVVTL